MRKSNETSCFTHLGLPVVSHLQASSMAQKALERQSAVDFTGYIDTPNRGRIFDDWHVRFGKGFTGSTILRVAFEVEQSRKFTLNIEGKPPRNPTEVGAYHFNITDMDRPGYISMDTFTGRSSRIIVGASPSQMMHLLQFAMKREQHATYDRIMTEVEVECARMGLRVVARKS